MDMHISAGLNAYMACNPGFEQDEQQQCERPVKKSNSLPIWGNEKTMNLNPLILTNIQSSQYFKVNLYKLKTYHEVIDEIYYQVNHLEPWEKGSRKTSGQTGMCGGVRGVGAGGIVSTAFCILYKLYTLKLTRKQVLGLINHADSPYIRGLGLMYIRFTQPPADLWEWFEGYLDDEEEIDVRAGGGQPTTIGTIVRHMLTKLDWHSTLFPRIPVPIQKDIEKKLSEKDPIRPTSNLTDSYLGCRDRVTDDRKRDEYNGDHNKSRGHYENDDRESKDRQYSKDSDRYSKDRDRYSRETDRYSRDIDQYSKDRDRDRAKHLDRDQLREKHRDTDRSRDYNSSRRHHSDYASELQREKERIRKERRRSRSQSRSRDRDRRRRERRDY